jgi:aryl-alcohol dehydrogenase-like predicted oxidoreductase
VQKRKLADGGLEVSAIGLCCTGMSWSYQTAQGQAGMISLLQAALDRRVTFFDTKQKKVTPAQIALP